MPTHIGREEVQRLVTAGTPARSHAVSQARRTFHTLAALPAAQARRVGEDFKWVC
jgi:hypothetical protein